MATLSVGPLDASVEPLYGVVGTLDAVVAALDAVVDRADAGGGGLDAAVGAFSVFRGCAGRAVATAVVLVVPLLAAIGKILANRASP